MSLGVSIEIIKNLHKYNCVSFLITITKVIYNFLQYYEDIIQYDTVKKSLVLLHVSLSVQNCLSRNCQ